MSNESPRKFSFLSRFSPREISRRITLGVSKDERDLAIRNNALIVEAWKQNQTSTKEALFTTPIICADGFSVNVAVNQSNWGDINLPIPGMTEVLHGLFHNFVKIKQCQGLRYKF